MRIEQDTIDDSSFRAENEAFLRSLDLARQIVSGWSDEVKTFNSIGFPVPNFDSVKALAHSESRSSSE